MEKEKQNMSEKTVEALWKVIEDVLVSAPQHEVALVEQFEAWSESRSVVHSMAKDRPELFKAYSASSAEGKAEILALFTSKAKRGSSDGVVATEAQVTAVEAHIKKSKGVGKADIVAAVALSSDVVGAALVALKKADKIKSTGQGRGAVWSAVKAAAAKAA